MKNSSLNDHLQSPLMNTSLKEEISPTKFSKPIQSLSPTNERKLVPVSHEKKPEVFKALFWSRTFYIGINLLYLAVLLVFQSEIVLQINEEQYIFPIIYAILMLTSSILFWTSGENPGYAPVEGNQDKELQPINHIEAAIDSNLPNGSYRNTEENPTNQKQFSNNFFFSEKDDDFHDALLKSGSAARKKNSSTNVPNPKNSLTFVQNFTVDNNNNNLKDEANKTIQNSGTHYQSYQKEDEEEKKDYEDQNKDNMFCDNNIDNSPTKEQLVGMYQHLVQIANLEAEANKRKSSRSSQQQSVRTSNTNKEKIEEEMCDSHVSVSMGSFDEEEEEDDSNFVPQLHYCEKCKRYQPFRSKHCDDCGRCILKFDHHCFWVGGCIGELNHRKFWIFLLLQTIVELITLELCLNLLDRYMILDSNGSESYEIEYYIFALLCFILFIFLLFTGVLCMYHTFLILSNQTTWEHNKRNDISYTRKLPKGFYPFSKGIFRNLLLICCHGNISNEWNVPRLQDARDLHAHSFNICENKYYSCC